MSAYTGQVPDTRRAADWRAQALCARPVFATRGDLWFPHRSDAQGVIAAKTLCGMCSVARDCLVAALREEGGDSLDRRFGVRGGLTAGERLALYRRYKAGRKAAA
ncbi:WhiB family transcriptional regulator [Streptomyces antibioticus]|uniref:WhiB family transcriptional regulator n=1 Tax=Streptomyces antibioticus TaxID=1890 RepID=UPI0036FB74BA